MSDAISNKREVGALEENQAAAGAHAERADGLPEHVLQQLRENEARLKFVTEHSADMIVRLDREERLLYVSPGCRRFGYEPDDLIDRGVVELVHPEDQPRLRTAIAALFSGAPVDEHRDRAYRFLTKAGDWVWIESNPTIIRDEQGRPIELVSVKRDISERRAAAEALADGERRYREQRDEAERALRRADDALRQLRDSEAQLRFVTEHSADIILRLDGQARVLFVSPSCRRYGYEPDELIGRSGLDLVHPEDLPRVQATIGQLFSGAPVDHSRDRSYRLRTKAGGWVWIEANPTVIRDEQGHPIELVSVHRDVSERKAAADAIAVSERRYRLLADSAIDLIISCDTEGVIEFASPAIRRFGYDPDEVVGESISALVHPDDREREDAFFLALNQGRPLPTGRENVWRATLTSGELVWLEGIHSPIRDDSGRTIGVVTVLRDVTSRRALEEELRRKSAEADAASVAKSQFLANMSHEIRNPLTVVIGYGKLLEKLAGLPARARTYIGRINTGARSLLAIVDDVLDFSRMEAGKIELDLQAFELSAFLTETVDQFLSASAHKGLDLRIDPRGTAPPIVRTDRRRLQQVLSNLIANAIKFTERGQVTVTVEYLPGPQALLRFEIADTGVGISAEGAGRLFERFSQIDASNTRPAGGSGLGLAIAKGLVEMMGGQIGVVSELGRGATFWFTIKAQAEVRSSAGETSPGLVWDHGPLSLLMVEDVEVNRDLVSDMLAPFDIQVTGVADGIEAVDAARRARFDLILMDLQMPRLDGLAATRAIRTEPGPNRLTPIVALSANVLQSQVEACLAAGMNDYIRKPFDGAELLAKIAHWARSARAGGSA